MTPGIIRKRCCRCLRRRRDRGYLMADMLTGLLLFGLLAGVLAVANARHVKASTRLAETRRLNDLMEARLLAMQAGESPQMATTSGDTITADRLSTAAPDGAIWIALRARSASGAHAELFGIVRSDALPIEPKAVAP